MVLFVHGGENVTDVRNVFITREVAEELNLTPTYLIKLAKKMELNETEMREAGNRNYLFSKEAVEKLKNRNKSK
nr:MAG TPA: hypothetical protein [Caudoviricetes sp.]